mgnify:FL=1|jgi:hypothetical protein|tara:strand:- start:6187 stop:6720 length:534 start_codon:yes stop_codon:yes gene_type:complete
MIDIQFFNKNTLKLPGLKLVKLEEYKDISHNYPDEDLGILFEPNSTDFGILKKYNNKIIIGTSKNEKIIRKLVEHKNIYGIVDIESDKGPDHTHYRRSNMNQVIAKLMKENNKVYFINFNSILKSRNKSKLIGRIRQNVILCNKYNTKIKVHNFSKNISDFRKDLSPVYKIFKIKNQ